MFVKFELSTNRAGCDTTEVYKVADDVTDEYLDELGDNLARDNADMYGIIEEAEAECEECGIEFEESCYYSANWEKLDMTEEEIEDEYGCYNEL